jgi:hypothetical protein
MIPHVTEVESLEGQRNRDQLKKQEEEIPTSEHLTTSTMNSLVCMRQFVPDSEEGCAILLMRTKQSYEATNSLE